MKITHPGGLHARPALAVAQTARRFAARVSLDNGRQAVDGKQVLELLTLGAACGTELTLLAKGDDAEAALEALAQLFAENFGMESEA